MVQSSVKDLSSTPSPRHQRRRTGFKSPSPLLSANGPDTSGVHPENGIRRHRATNRLEALQLVIRLLSAGFHILCDLKKRILWDCCLI